MDQFPLLPRLPLLVAHPLVPRPRSRVHSLAQLPHPALHLHQRHHRPHHPSAEWDHKLAGECVLSARLGCWGVVRPPARHASSRCTYAVHACVCTSAGSWCRAAAPPAVVRAGQEGAIRGMHGQWASLCAFGHGRVHACTHASSCVQGSVCVPGSGPSGRPGLSVSLSTQKAHQSHVNVVPDDHARDWTGYLAMDHNPGGGAGCRGPVVGGLPQLRLFPHSQ